MTNENQKSEAINEDAQSGLSSASCSAPDRLLEIKAALNAMYDDPEITMWSDLLPSYQEVLIRWMVDEIERLRARAQNSVSTTASRISK